MESRIPAHLEVSGLLRAIDGAGGFGTVIHKGERDAGTLLLICCRKGTSARAFERMPQPDGTRAWTLAREQDADNPAEFWDYCDRRGRQDQDLWVIELDIDNPERFVDLPGTQG